MAKPNGARRVGSAEFKLEAVRQVQERRPGGVSLAQMGRELGVRPDMLRAGSKQADERVGAVPRDVFQGHGRLPTEQEELRRLQHENARLAQEHEVLKRAAAMDDSRQERAHRDSQELVFSRTRCVPDLRRFRGYGTV